MAAEIRVDTIKNRSGINTVAFAESTQNVVILGSVGIGTTSVTNTVTTATNAKVAVGIIVAKIYSLQEHRILKFLLVQQDKDQQQLEDN